MDLRALRALVGDRSVVDDPHVLAGVETDWTRRFTGHAAAMVTPSTTDEVAAVLRWCASEGVAVVPQGGNTGLVGGAVPMNGELVVSLRRMARIEAVHEAAGQLTAQGGATIAAVQDAARAIGWDYGVDFAARDAATIGGSVATNAGGLHVLRHGDTRRQVVGIEAVTGAGEIVGDLRGLLKDNTGYHLPSVFCGSEGTLGIVTRVRLRLVPQPTEVAVALFGFASVDDAMDATALLRREVTELRALELVLRPGVELVCREHRLPDPLGSPHAAYLLAEVAGPEGVFERFMTGPAGTLVEGDHVAVATDALRRAALWRYREAHTEAIARLGVPHKLDVTVPHEALASFVSEVGRVVAEIAPDAAVYLFGHAGDGNIHVNVVGPGPNDDAVDAAVFGLAARLGGSISAEHGIGRAKASHLHLNRTRAELVVFGRIKHAFDPAGIMNPGALLPVATPAS